MKFILKTIIKFIVLITTFFIITSCSNSNDQPSAADHLNSAPSSSLLISGDLSLNGYKLINASNVASVSNEPTLANDGQTLRWNSSLKQWDWFSVSGSGAGVSNISIGAGPLSVTNPSTTPVISISSATASQDGYLSSVDFTTFNDKLGETTFFSGDVSGNYNSLTLATTMLAPGTATKVSYDMKGRVTSATSLNSNDVTTALSYIPLANSLASSKVFIGNAVGVATAMTLSGDATLSQLGILTFANVVSPGQYVRVTVDSKGRVTSGASSLDLSSAAVSGLLPVTKGGTGASSFNVNSILVGNGTSAFNSIDPNQIGYVLTSNGNSWTAGAPSLFSSYLEITKSIALPQDRSGVRYTFHGSSDAIVELPDIFKS